MLQARVPVASAPASPAAESQSVAQKQLQKRGRYSSITLKLKVSSIALVAKLLYDLGRAALGHHIMRCDYRSRICSRMLLAGF
jgi:hypothetical protein